MGGGDGNLMPPVCLGSLCTVQPPADSLHLTSACHNLPSVLSLLSLPFETIHSAAATVI